MKHLILFLALTFAPVAAATPTETPDAIEMHNAMSEQPPDADVIQSETSAPMSLVYELPDNLRARFPEAFEAAVGAERDSATLCAQAMNVIDKLFEQGLVPRQHYEVIISERPEKRRITVHLSSLHYGELTYRAYSWATDNKTFDGREMPTFAALPERIQNAWAAAAVAARGAT
jgi:hypothetical protein